MVVFEDKIAMKSHIQFGVGDKNPDLKHLESIKMESAHKQKRKNEA